MAFIENNVETFMGGEFRFEDKIKTPNQLIHELQSWIEEVKSWGDVGISECVMIDNQMQVTLDG